MDNSVSFSFIFVYYAAQEIELIPTKSYVCSDNKFLVKCEVAMCELYQDVKSEFTYMWFKDNMAVQIPDDDSDDQFSVDPQPDACLSELRLKADVTNVATDVTCVVTTPGPPLRTVSATTFVFPESKLSVDNMITL